jgi:hypothetical protein
MKDYPHDYEMGTYGNYRVQSRINTPPKIIYTKKEGEHTYVA